MLSELGGVSLETFTFGVATDLDRSETNDTSVDTAGNAVLLLDVDLGEREVLLVKSIVVFNVSL